MQHPAAVVRPRDPIKPIIFLEETTMKKILSVVLLAAMALMKRGTNKRVYGGV